MKYITNKYKYNKLPNYNNTNNKLPILYKFSSLNISTFISKNTKNNLKNLIKYHIINIYINK